MARLDEGWTGPRPEGRRKRECQAQPGGLPGVWSLMLFLVTRFQMLHWGRHNAASPRMQHMHSAQRAGRAVRAAAPWTALGPALAQQAMRRKQVVLYVALLLIVVLLQYQQLSALGHYLSILRVHREVKENKDKGAESHPLPSSINMSPMKGGGGTRPCLNDSLMILCSARPSASEHQRGSSQVHTAPN
ncbi:unnamed protein product [Pleuronectes platessa]|uniref:Uncharacterized protein n=1 Tax=Pleuronectes platessa TaxID=8262 RepID=A0A9N7TPD8_PLEPL|nr:unnamed protein product [Pleuronectes platessa]